jgi:SMODS-associated and fused to various effectors sensor domain/SAVED-fused 2TM effector domain
MTEFFKSIALRVVDWLTRPRNIGLKLIAAGVMLLVATLGVDWLGQFDYQDKQRRVSFKLATGDSLPKWMTLAAYGLGMLLVLAGLALVLYSFIADRKQNSRKRAIVVEVRGLHASPDTPAKDAELGDFPRFREGLRLDFRPKTEAEQVDPALALQKIAGMKSNIQTLADGRDPSDVTVAIGGLAAVPALFLAGMLLDDESAITLYDWQRDAKRWKVIDGPDDGKRLQPVDFTSLPAAADEVVLAVSLSYMVNLPAVSASFPALPVLELKAELVAADKYWSSEKQQAVVAEFRAVVQKLLHRGVNRIHLVLAAPASLSIRLGMTYDRRLLPELLVYQYEKSATPPYPWAFMMPTHGKTEASLIPSRAKT